MPVVKGGVWTNIEDEILKAAVSKYGLNQWARVSSLLARKTPKQCKARWTEWLDPGIRKIEWSKEEDEKLLHLAKLMPTQWRTIAPIVGRTATQCLERYQRLLDEAEARENDELGLGGPEGGETAAPTGDDVRKLRPGELDPDPESKPARPDTIDLDEDEKEMLSEARARLANTQGKKAKRKARERQLEESRRLAVLQKRRELKNAGINIKITNRKKGQMDYNADIPFEKPAQSGFYDTTEEQVRNEFQREAFDPRKQQLANKRKGDQEDDGDRKKRKNEKSSQSELAAAAARAGAMAKIREAEQQTKRRSLNLPAPQVSESELEDIVKMGMAGERAARAAGNENDGLVSQYSNMMGATPIRTPKAPAQEDRIANEIKNIRALTETQSSLLGGENTPLHEGSGSTGFEGVAPRKQDIFTPNPMATPFRQGGAGVVGATPIRGTGPGATPMRTPRDNFAINENGGAMLPYQTPQDLKMHEKAVRTQIRAKLSALPKPKETEWELEELPSELPETNGDMEISEEDQAEIDRRNEAIRKAAADAEFRRQSQVLQKSLPRPKVVDVDAMKETVETLSDQIEAMISREAISLIANDARKFPPKEGLVKGSAPKLSKISDEYLSKAREAIQAEYDTADLAKYNDAFMTSIEEKYASNTLPDYFNADTSPEEYSAAFSLIQDELMSTAEKGNKLEKKLALHLGGYQARARTLRAKINEAADALEKATISRDSFISLQIGEEAAISRRLEGLREQVGFVSKREREAQDEYRKAKQEMRDLQEALGARVNGH
ncbi:putative pre-mrna-splicing factor cef1 [Phaeomoniella chlamydospora]|uniref:Putative pre-mrna-splicing factor cef1 n=1 Tax=Phaeomoniella chlamydospora TaxID=158046 RepID=A0A0G2GI09_PHACM|nr:putative pre-mrna-splicing factor cef1 [Phaeomoniella chlamydospora]